MRVKKRKGWQPHGTDFLAACPTCKNDASDLCDTCLKELKSGYDPKDSFAPTNADRIRAMNDEELAEFLCGVFDDDECNGKYICGTTIAEYDQYNIAEYLKLPVQEE